MTHNKILDLFYSFFPVPDKYLTYGVGRTNVLISAPHGGNIKPINIPPRTWGNRGRDTYTRRLTQKIIELMDKKPYYIYSDIHRSRVDLNRSIHEAAQGNKHAEKIWLTWNDTLATYITMMRRMYRRCLYIDIHSHNNHDKFQIGYGLNAKDYKKVLGGRTITALSTLSPLYTKESDQREFLFGKSSFPYILENYGYRVLIPKDDQDYLSGGRNIKVYSGSGIGSLQIECPVSILKYNLDDVAQILSQAIESFTIDYIFRQ